MDEIPIFHLVLWRGTEARPDDRVDIEHTCIAAATRDRAEELARAGHRNVVDTGSAIVPIPGDAARRGVVLIPRMRPMFTPATQRDGDLAVCIKLRGRGGV